MICKACNQPEPVEAADRHFCCGHDLEQSKRIDELEEALDQIGELPFYIMHNEPVIYVSEVRAIIDKALEGEE